MSAPPAPSAERPLVTFFVMAYRQEALVREAIEGAFAQTWSPLEIILSDDCSPDGTFRVMQDMAAAYRGPHRVVLNRNPVNLGIVPHIDHIMEIATGAFVVQNAGDDVSRPDRTERLAGLWLASGRRTKLVHSAATVIDAQKGKIDVRRPKSLMIEAPTPLHIIRDGLVALGAASAWDRELFDVFGPLGGDLGVEDTVLPFRAALMGGIAYTDEELVSWRAGGESWTPAERGVDHLLYGIRLRLARWRAQNARHVLSRFAERDYPDKAAVEAICRDTARRAGFTVALAEASTARRAAMVPQALREALRQRSATPLKDWARYLFERPYATYWHARHGRASERGTA